MGNAIGGIGALLGQGLGNSSQQTQAMLTAQQMAMRGNFYPGPTARDVHFPGKLLIHDDHCKVERDFNRDAYKITDSADCWLNSRIDTIRVLGREWLGKGYSWKSVKPIAKSKVPPAVGGVREPLRMDGIPVKRTATGDYVYVYPDDHNLPAEVLAKWQQKGLLNARV